MNLRHLFRQLKLIAESSAFAFRLCKAVPFLNKVILRTIICKIQITILKRFYNLFFGQLRLGVKYPLNYFFPGIGLHISTFSKLMDTFTKTLIIQSGHPRFKWLIPTHIKCLDIFCAPTWNDHAIYIYFLQILSHAVSHMTRCQSYDLLNEKAPKTCFT